MLLRVNRQYGLNDMPIRLHARMFNTYQAARPKAHSTVPIM